MFRLALINPNTDSRHTEAMGAVAREALPDGCEVTAVSPERGPASIESEADSVVAAAAVAALVRELPAHDAYLVACFGDPGVGAARELTEAPVVGIGEAAFQAAAMIARRFAVITTLRRGIPELEDALERHGMRSRCVAVEPLEIPVADQGGHNPETTAAIVDAGRRVVSAERRRGARPGLRRHGRRRPDRPARGRCARLRRRRVRRDGRVLALALRPLDEQGGRVRMARADRLCRHAGVQGRRWVIPSDGRHVSRVRRARGDALGGGRRSGAGPDEVLLEVRACGLNHSDLDSRAGTSRWPFPMPWVLGAEFAGTVAASGADVEGIAPGDPVTVYQQYACGTCAACVRWRQDLCERFVVFGTDRWGGYAELATVPARAVIPLCGEDEFVPAASAQCVVSTAWSMVTSVAAIGPGETVLVPSASGGVAGAAVQAAVIAGAG